MTLSRALATVFALLMPATALAHGTEADFEYVSHMPQIQGDMTRAANGGDADGSLDIRLEIFELGLGAAVLETRATYMRCAGRGTFGEGAVPHILALKFRPKKPKTFAVATLHDIYTEAYVRESKGRVRLYRNLNSKQMQILTDKYKPFCPSI